MQIQYRKQSCSHGIVAGKNRVYAPLLRMPRNLMTFSFYDMNLLSPQLLTLQNSALQNNAALQRSFAIAMTHWLLINTSHKFGKSLRFCFGSQVNGIH